MNMDQSSDFSSMSVEERREWVIQSAALSPEQQALLRQEGGLPLEIADSMIDNVIGTYALPIGVVRGVVVNGKEYLVPMVCEEPWVVNCAEKGARLAAQCGGFCATYTGSIMISQIQLVQIANPRTACLRILERKQEILELANQADPVLVSLGGGAFDVEAKPLSTESGNMVIAQLLVDTKDAMGANAVNTMAEKAAPLLAQIAGGRAYLRILSNLAIHRLARARVRVSQEALGGSDIADGILAAHAFAWNDPFRACTSNKGTMNGISPVACATGNDIRALESGAHAYAARSGVYRPITCWERNSSGDLEGMIELPMAVGIVGGTTRTHPMAGLMLRLMRVESAAELGMVIAAIGLAENLWTLRALSAGGLQAEFVPSLERRREA